MPTEQDVFDAIDLYFDGQMTKEEFDTIHNSWLADQADPPPIDPPDPPPTDPPDPPPVDHTPVKYRDPAPVPLSPEPEGGREIEVYDTPVSKPTEVPDGVINPASPFSTTPTADKSTVDESTVDETSKPTESVTEPTVKSTVRLEPEEEVSEDEVFNYIDRYFAGDIEKDEVFDRVVDYYRSNSDTPVPEGLDLDDRIFGTSKEVLTPAEKYKADLIKQNQLLFNIRKKLVDAGFGDDILGAQISQLMTTIATKGDTATNEERNSLNGLLRESINKASDKQRISIDEENAKNLAEFVKAEQDFFASLPDIIKEKVQEELDKIVGETPPGTIFELAEKARLSYNKGQHVIPIVQDNTLSPEEWQKIPFSERKKRITEEQLALIRSPWYYTSGPLYGHRNKEKDDLYRHLIESGKFLGASEWLDLEDYKRGSVVKRTDKQMEEADALSVAFTKLLERQAEELINKPNPTEADKRRIKGLKGSAEERYTSISHKNYFARKAYKDNLDLQNSTLSSIAGRLTSAGFGNSELSTEIGRLAEIIKTKRHTATTEELVQLNQLLRESIDLAVKEQKDWVTAENKRLQEEFKEKEQKLLAGLKPEIRAGVLSELDSSLLEADLGGSPVSISELAAKHTAIFNLKESDAHKQELIDIEAKNKKSLDEAMAKLTPPLRNKVQLQLDNFVLSSGAPYYVAAKGIFEKVIAEETDRINELNRVNRVTFLADEDAAFGEVHPQFSTSAGVTTKLITGSEGLEDAISYLPEITQQKILSEVDSGPPLTAKGIKQVVDSAVDELNASNLLEFERETKEYNTELDELIGELPINRQSTTFGLIDLGIDKLEAYNLTGGEIRDDNRQAIAYQEIKDEELDAAIKELPEEYRNKVWDLTDSTGLSGAEAYNQVIAQVISNTKHKLKELEDDVDAAIKGLPEKYRIKLWDLTDATGLSKIEAYNRVIGQINSDNRQAAIGNKLNEEEWYGGLPENYKSFILGYADTQVGATPSTQGPTTRSDIAGLAHVAIRQEAIGDAYEQFKDKNPAIANEFMENIAGGMSPNDAIDNAKDALWHRERSVGGIWEDYLSRASQVPGAFLESSKESVQSARDDGLIIPGGWSGALDKVRGEGWSGMSDRFMDQAAAPIIGLSAVADLAHTAFRTGDLIPHIPIESPSYFPSLGGRAQIDHVLPSGDIFTANRLLGDTKDDINRPIASATGLSEDSMWLPQTAADMVLYGLIGAQAAGWGLRGATAASRLGVTKAKTGVQSLASLNFPELAASVARPVGTGLETTGLLLKAPTRAITQPLKPITEPIVNIWGPRIPNTYSGFWTPGEREALHRAGAAVQNIPSQVSGVATRAGEALGQGAGYVTRPVTEHVTRPLTEHVTRLLPEKAYSGFWTPGETLTFYAARGAVQNIPSQVSGVAAKAGEVLGQGKQVLGQGAGHVTRPFTHTLGQGGLWTPAEVEAFYRARGTAQNIIGNITNTPDKIGEVTTRIGEVLGQGAGHVTRPFTHTLGQGGLWTPAEVEAFYATRGAIQNIPSQVSGITAKAGEVLGQGGQILGQGAGHVTRPFTHTLGQGGLWTPAEVEAFYRARGAAQNIIGNITSAPGKISEVTAGAGEVLGQGAGHVTRPFTNTLGQGGLWTPAEVVAFYKARGAAQNIAKNITGTPQKIIDRARVNENFYQYQKAMAEDSKLNDQFGRWIHDRIEANYGTLSTPEVPLVSKAPPKPNLSGFPIEEHGPFDDALREVFRKLEPEVPPKAPPKPNLSGFPIEEHGPFDDALREVFRKLEPEVPPKAPPKPNLSGFPIEEHGPFDDALREVFRKLEPEVPPKAPPKPNLSGFPIEEHGPFDDALREVFRKLEPEVPPKAPPKPNLSGFPIEEHGPFDDALREVFRKLEPEVPPKAPPKPKWDDILDDIIREGEVDDIPSGGSTTSVPEGPGTGSASEAPKGPGTGSASDVPKGPGTGSAPEVPPTSPSGETTAFKPFGTTEFTELRSGLVVPLEDASIARVSTVTEGASSPVSTITKVGRNVDDFPEVNDAFMQAGRIDTTGQYATSIPSPGQQVGKIDLTGQSAISGFAPILYDGVDGGVDQLFVPYSGVTSPYSVPGFVESPVQPGVTSPYSVPGFTEAPGQAEFPTGNPFRPYGVPPSQIGGLTEIAEPDIAEPPPDTIDPEPVSPDEEPVSPLDPDIEIEIERILNPPEEVPEEDDEYWIQIERILNPPDPSEEIPELIPDTTPTETPKIVPRPDWIGDPVVPQIYPTPEVIEPDLVPDEFPEITPDLVPDEFPETDPFQQPEFDPFQQPGFDPFTEPVVVPDEVINPNEVTPPDIVTTPDTVTTPDIVTVPDIVTTPDIITSPGIIRRTRTKRVTDPSIRFVPTPQPEIIAPFTAPALVPELVPYKQLDIIPEPVIYTPPEAEPEIYTPPEPATYTLPETESVIYTPPEPTPALRKVLKTVPEVSVPPVPELKLIFKPRYGGGIETLPDITLNPFPELNLEAPPPYGGGWKKIDRIKIDTSDRPPNIPGGGGFAGVGFGSDSIVQLNKRQPIAWQEGAWYISVHPPYTIKNIRKSRKPSRGAFIANGRNHALDLLDDLGSNITESHIARKVIG